MMDDYNCFNIQQNSGFMRYCSAPSSCLETLDNVGSSYAGIDGGLVPSTPAFTCKMEDSITGCASSATASSFLDVGGFGDKSNEPEMLPQNFDARSYFDLMNKMKGSTLLRQSSSPAQLLSYSVKHNEFCLTRDSGRKAASNPPASSSFKLHSGSRFMPQIPEMGQMDNIPTFEKESWSDISAGVIRKDEGSGDLVSAPSTSETRSSNLGNRFQGLTHHLSLPKSYTEKTMAENFENSQGFIPYRIRAKRGCATNPRSIAERVRRTRISERMKKLQKLFPDLSEQTSTANMLEMAVERIKDLQRQVKTLADMRAECRCSK